jgi:bacillithiol biosynthesis cysteine-adding enzyme BshC
MPSESDAQPASEAVRQSFPLGQLPWIRAIVDVYSNDYSSVASLFAGDPAQPSAWQEAIERARSAPRDRDALASVLGRQLERRGAPELARAAAERLRLPGTVAVVSGQQAGACGGPLYTILKAVTAIQLARRISIEHAVDVVPIFWVADEDHDWEEVRTIDVLDREFTPVHLSLPPLPAAGEAPVAALTLDQGTDAVLDAVQASLAPTEFTAEIMTALRRRYRAGTGVGRAFAGWIDDLLGSEGLVVFEGSDPAAKPMVADLFVAELDHPGRTSRLALERGGTMRQMGHPPQVEPTDDATALFYLDGASRLPIRLRDGQFTIADTPRASEGLRAEAAAHPERFSPNVLLRPVVQDRLFPTICYVPGPSELAYQGQLGPVYEAFGMGRPLLVPRATATIVDSAAARFIDNVLPLAALQSQDESALNRVLESQLPPAIERGLETTALLVVEQAASLREAVKAIDPTLSGAVDSTIERVRDTLRSLQGKIVQASKRKDETLRRQFTRTRALTFPEGHPQERALNVTFFVNRYGLDFPARLIEILPAATDKHHLIVM